MRMIPETIAMPEQRIPRADGAFSAWLGQYLQAAAQWWDAHGGDGNLDPLRDLFAQWQADYAAQVAARAASEAARQSKEGSRIACEAEVRRMTRLIQGTPDTSNAQRAAIGITVRTPPGAARTPAPASRPLLLVESGSRLTHRLRLVDESTPTRAARPRGTLGAEVYLALVQPRQAPPADLSSYKFVRTVTRGSAEVTFEMEQGGETAAYLVRWVSATGEPGPWSETVTATVAA